ncbi:uncharacterized protein [Diadema antillarum]|uniref:uncharacterized protein n=1 Tax=Diadema antillarum TaxID=105358 RepID=UPI003A851BBB
MFGSKLIAVTEKNMIRICLVVLLLDQDYHSGRCMPIVSTPTRASCDAKCTYSEATREANCEYRQLSEVPTECNAATYLSLNHNQIERIEPRTFQGFYDLEVLILSNNKIKQLGANAFTGAPKLKEIYLYDNNVEIFDSLALDGTNGGLQLIDLSNNCIKYIESGTFQFVVKLKFIALYNNSLSRLNPGVFDNLRHLEVLDLGSNKLKTLPSDIFMHLIRLQTIILSENQLMSTGRVLLLPRITTLDMRNNNLTRLANITEETLGRLQVLLLEGNPWNCNCQLETLRLWYSRRNSQGDHRAYVDSPTCYEPHILANQPINGVLEGFCANLNFNSTTDSPMTTKLSSDEINNITSPDTNKPKSPGRSNLIVAVTLIILTMLLVCMMLCVLKHKCRTSKRNLQSKTKTTNDQQQPDSTSFPQSEHQIASENILMGNGSVNEGRAVKHDRCESEPITNESTPMINSSVQGAQEAPTHERERRTNETTPKKINGFKGNTAVKGRKTLPVSFCYEKEKARKQLSF